MSVHVIGQHDFFALCISNLSLIESTDVETLNIEDKLYTCSFKDK